VAGVIPNRRSCSLKFLKAADARNQRVGVGIRDSSKDKPVQGIRAGLLKIVGEGFYDDDGFHKDFQSSGRISERIDTTRKKSRREVEKTL
jgi:hypothetical protein